MVADMIKEERLPTRQRMALEDIASFPKTYIYTLKQATMALLETRGLVQRRHGVVLGQTPVWEITPAGSRMVKARHQ